MPHPHPPNQLHPQPLPQSHPDFYTQALQFTPTIHRSLYPSLNPTTSSYLRDVAASKPRHRVLITGAGSGFGRAAALAWARAGAAEVIVLCGRRREGLERVREEVRGLVGGVGDAAERTVGVDVVPEVVVAVGDVSVEEDVRRVFDIGGSAGGGGRGIDVVVHAAGVMGPMARIGDVDAGEWWDGVTINLKGCFLVARQLIRQSTDGHGAAATFIHVGTAASYFASPAQSSYTVAKAADNMLVSQLHAEYPTLRVFNVHPGMAKSSVLPPQLEPYAKDDPALFGSFTIFLLHPKAEFLRGRFVSVNWDVDELVRWEEEIVNEGLLLGQAFKGRIGPGGCFAGEG